MLGYRAHAKKCKPLLHCTESLQRDDIEIHVFGLQIKTNVITELLTS